MIIRRAESGDKLAVFQLARAFATSFAAEQPAFERSLWGVLRTHPEAFLAVAEVGNEVAGYLLGFEHLDILRQRPRCLG